MSLITKGVEEEKKGLQKLFLSIYQSEISSREKKVRNFTSV
jgi:hypothetical protein